MFGEKKQALASKLEMSDESTASSDNEDQFQSLYFTVEEIESLSDSEKFIYMNKLQHDSKIVYDRLTEVIEKVKRVRGECIEAIEGGQETLDMYADYNFRMEKVNGKAMDNLGCKKEDQSFCGMGK